MTPTKPTPLQTLIYLDTSLIDWTARKQAQWGHQQPTDQEAYSNALTDFSRALFTEQCLLSEKLQAWITDWKARVASNRTAMGELNQLGHEVSTVLATAEATTNAPIAFSRSELLEKLEHATGAFEQAVHHASIRLKAVQTLMVRRAMLGAPSVFEPPVLYTSRSKSPSKTDRRNYEIILQLETRTFHSPTQYFREIGRRCVEGRGKPVGHATINGWFKKEGLYKGKDDRDMEALQARAVARAKKVLADAQPVSKE